MAYLKLGQILLQQGLITEEQLNRAIAAQKQEQGRIGEIFVKLGIIKEEDIISALGKQLGLPYASRGSGLLAPQSDQNLEELVPKDFAQKNLVLPLSRNMNSLTCAVFDPSDLLLIDNLKKMTGCEINLVLATRSDIVRAIEDFYSDIIIHPSMLGQAVQSTYQSSGPLASDTASLTKDYEETELSLDKLIARAEEAPVVKLVDLIIRQAIDEKASDIHIEPCKDKINLRYRIDGSLYEIPPPAKHLHLPIVSRIKILAKLDIAEKRLPQDGSIGVKLDTAIAFVARRIRPTDMALYIMNQDGSAQTRVTSSTNSDWSPAWSPDRSRIAYYNNDTGGWDVYTIKPDGTDKRKLMAPARDVSQTPRLTMAALRGLQTEPESSSTPTEITLDMTCTP